MSFVYFTKHWPCRNINAQRQRSISLLESICNLNKQLVLCSADLNNEGRQVLDDYPITIMDINPNKISNSLSKARLNPSMFLFDSVETEEMYSGFIYNKWNKCPRIMDMNSLPNLQLWRKKNFNLIQGYLNPKNGQMHPTAPQQIFTQSEIQAINRCDYIFTGSQYINYLLSTVLKNKSNSYVSFGYPLDQFQVEIRNMEFRPYVNRKHFVFLGDLSRASVKQSLNCLIEFIWPLIQKQLPDAKLYIYSQYQDSGLSTKKSKLSAKNIIYDGYLQDIEELSKFRALLYPVTCGVGIRLKIRESFFNHLPVVTTPIGAEGLFMESLNPFLDTDPVNKENMFTSERKLTDEEKKNQKVIQNYYNLRKLSKNGSLTFGGSWQNFTYQQFVKSAIKLYSDQEYWKQCLKKSHKYIQVRQNDSQISKNIKSALVKAEIAAYEGRKRPEYVEQWKKYTKSSAFLKKIHQ